LVTSSKQLGAGFVVGAFGGHSAEKLAEGSRHAAHFHKMMDEIAPTRKRAC
jgi:hypothetical protein